MKDIKEIKTIDIPEIKRPWSARNAKFREWISILNLTDKYKSQDMESYVSNEPRTFLNMALYLMTAGRIRHIMPIEGDNAVELEKQSRVERACDYMWRLINEERMRGGGYPLDYELAFNLLVLGWYSLARIYDKESNRLKVQLWSPAEVYPRYEDNTLAACLHEYSLDIRAAKRKAANNNWNYSPRRTTGNVVLQDYFFLDENNNQQNVVLIDNEPVMPITAMPEVALMVAPVAGFPEKALQSVTNQVANLGQGIFAANAGAYDALNKWVAFQLQILRETTEPKWMETSTGTPKVNPEDLRKRGAVFQFSPGEGIAPIQSPPPPIELSGAIMSIRRELSKGSFSDLVYGLGEEARSGLSASQLTESSANSVLHPYISAKHFIVAECDKFWLSQLKTSKHVFEIKGKRIEKLHPTDIPEDISIIVESELATPKDWMERATIAGMLKEQLDDTTILNDILKVQDTQEITERKSDDLIQKHPMSINLKLSAAYRKFADYLRYKGDARQAAMFEKAADALESQLGAPPAGAAKPTEATEAESKRLAAAPAERARVRPSVAAPGSLSALTPEERREYGRR